MKRSNRLLILLGIIVAIAGGVGAAVLANGSGGGGGGNGSGPSASITPAPTPEPTVQIVVAKQNINAGDTITAAMVGLKAFTISEAATFGPDTFNTTDQVIGNIAAVSVASGQAITASRDFLSTAGTVTAGKDISNAITKGMVAVAMEVDQTNGVGALIVPGDHVDIILSVYVDQIALSSKDASGMQVTVGGGSQVTTKMIIRNRRILATLLAPISPEGAVPTANPSTLQVNPSPTAEVVQLDSRHMITIVEVMPEEAEVIRWAQRTEKQDPQNYIDLSFALRSRADDATKGSTADTGGITYYQLVQNYGVLPPDPRALIPAKLGVVIQW